jgi:hypothetical protein
METGTYGKAIVRGRVTRARGSIAWRERIGAGIIDAFQNRCHVFFQVSCGTGESDAIEGAGRMQPRDRCSNSVIRRAARLPSPLSITDQTDPVPTHHRDHTDPIQTHHRGHPDSCLVYSAVVLGRRLIVFGLSRSPPDSRDGCDKERDRNNIH